MSSDTQRRARFEAVTEEVFEPLQRYLRRRTDRDSAEDALADVLLTIWRRIDDVPPERALPWSYGVARRTLANQRRSRSRHLRLVARLEAEPHQDREPDPAEAGADPDLTSALEEMNAGDREILRLWAWEQLEPREMAPVLGISVNAATLRLGRARSRLADRLRGQNRASSGHEADEGTQEQP